MARHLKKVKPGGQSLGIALPEAQGKAYHTFAGYVPHRDDFLGAALDVDEWVSSAGGTSAVTVTSGVATIAGSTATGSTITTRIFSAMSAGGNIYNVPFRVEFTARISTTAGIGVAPTGGLDAYLGIRDTGDTHIAQFHFDLTTAGSTSMLSPVVNTEVRAGSTAVGYIATAQLNPFTSAAGGIKTATAFMGYIIEVTHRGTWFGLREDSQSVEPPRTLAFFEGPNPRIDLNYYLDARLVSNGTAGYTQTAAVNLDITAVTVEQVAPTPPASIVDPEMVPGTIKTGYGYQAVASAGALITSGAGMFLGASVTSSATAAADMYVGVYDASAASTSIFDFVAAADASAVSRLIWLDQVKESGSAGTELGVNRNVIPPTPMPFFRGLLVGACGQTGSAGGATSVTVLAVYRSQRRGA